jgi:hypothetical protein
MGYDVKCYELAELFLADEIEHSPTREKHAARLAQEIQNHIETFLAFDEEWRMDSAAAANRSDVALRGERDG